jgi:hypothetical protein
MTTHNWDQQPGEPNSDYAKFLVYRNLGTARSLDRAYRQHKATTCCTL